MLAILAILFVAIPTLGILNMACCGPAMMSMGGMMEMSVVGFVWMVLALAVTIGLIVIAVRNARRV